MLAFILFTVTAAAREDCPRQPNWFDSSLNACQKLQSAKDAEGLNRLLARLGARNTCALTADTATPETLRQICADPAGFVCRGGRGNYFTSRCELGLANASDVAKIDDYTGTECVFQGWERDFVAAHRERCAPGAAEQDCDATVRLLYKQEILKKERELFYTPERMARIKRIFDRVQAEYVKMLRESTLIPAAHKQELIDLIANTKLHDSLEAPAPTCMNTEPGGPGTSLYNETGKDEIVICIGELAQLERVSDYDLYATFGHEISHSIDPCSLEEEHGIDPNATFPGLLSCMRGGGGANGCEKAVLHCNSERGYRDAAAAQMAWLADPDVLRQLPPEERERDLQEIVANYRCTPDCPYGKEDPGQDASNSADFRKVDEPMDQIREAFADYGGAEVTGRIARQDAESGKLDDRAKVDALTSIAADFAQLHGGCREENTNDSHPTGYLRMNRSFMGSSAFRNGIGCPAGAPPPPEGMSCHGL